MISLEALPKVIDSTQLTSDLDGTLQYDHAQWIDLRLVSLYLFLCLYHISYHGVITMKTLVKSIDCVGDCVGTGRTSVASWRTSRPIG